MSLLFSLESEGTFHSSSIDAGRMLLLLELLKLSQFLNLHACVYASLCFCAARLGDIA